MKKVLNLVSVVSLILCLFSGSALASEPAKSGPSPSEFFINFVAKCFSEGNRLLITDANGNDVTNTVYDSFHSAYNDENYSYILEYLNNNNLNISRIWTVEDSKKQPVNDLRNHCETDSVLRAPTEHKTVSQEFYDHGSTTGGYFEKEWSTIITGTFYYNANTYNIISSNTPDVSIGGPGWGTAFSPYPDKVSGWYTIAPDKSTITYYGKYRMKCTLLVSIEGFPFNTTLDYGDVSHSFTARP